LSPSTRRLTRVTVPKVTPDPLIENRPGELPPCRFVAEIDARTDASRGVWKALAGIDASLTGVSELNSVLIDLENGTLTIGAINCQRTLFVGQGGVGHRRYAEPTMGSEWKYVPVRRLALLIEESLFRGA
jgi:hypothetical protein